MLKFRIVASVLLFLSILYLPFWMTVTLGLIFIFAFKDYYEALALFAFSDFVYAFPGGRFGKFTLVGFSLALVFVLSARFASKTYSINRI
jgi:hypothetical protein